ncbi:membrane protein, partial [Escherichia coli]
FQGASSSFGFCQILGRYTMSLGWSKYWGVLGVLPVTNIVLFLILIFFKKR